MKVFKYVHTDAFIVAHLAVHTQLPRHCVCRDAGAQGGGKRETCQMIRFLAPF